MTLVTHSVEFVGGDCWPVVYYMILPQFCLMCFLKSVSLSFSLVVRYFRIRITFVVFNETDFTTFRPYMIDVDLPMNTDQIVKWRMHCIERVLFVILLSLLWC